jgi:hypothetical protein
MADAMCRAVLPACSMQAGLVVHGAGLGPIRRFVGGATQTVVGAKLGLRKDFLSRGAQAGALHQGWGM